ncbi:ricin-type beta-trefoil lectin domain protein [Streptacidiphilus sp. ASG 303]|uniref:ricin-type beta-trefoil lectin domain protein n=1 Tax=Streptacidiphilus sp. ASG 303 TaxID=2896847 RepID=UPI00272C2D28|nr:ricin-type beta-trefoil lectin domain protein [Streptacidiphilus sp. ASG 303]
MPGKLAKTRSRIDAAAKAPAALRVSTVSRATAEKAGVRGLLVTVAPVDTAARTQASIEVDYSSIQDAFGGNWSSRLRLVQLPPCVLTTPAKPACRTQSPIPASANDLAHRHLVADLDLPASPTPTPPPAAQDVIASSNTLVLAATATPGGGEGTYAATSLAPSSQWSVGNTGAFTWSYPVTVPPGLGGEAPAVTLSYDSSSVDGRTSATSAQASWIGDGWDYSPGFIERSYRSCDDDGQKDDYDQCWAGTNATVSMGSHSGTLIPANADGTSWRLAHDDGSRIDLVSGAANGLQDGEYWRLSDPDGTRYYFGANHLPGGDGSDTATQSAWGVPVYGNDSGEPCHGATFDTSLCAKNMGWRWNLDFVVDPHGNTTAYTYAPETNYYAAGPTHDLKQYVRGGTLAKITYGQRTGDYATNTPAARVTFTTSQRCLSTTGTNAFNCETTAISTTNASHWPDVPYDQNCASTGACTNYAPSFWSAKRLTKIATEVYDAGTSAYRAVDTYTLTQSFPDPGDGTKPALWLNSIVHTGNDTGAGGSAVTLPPITFGGTEPKPNRVDGLEQPQNIPPLNRIRLGSLTTETGEQITVTYKDDASCSRTALPAEDADDQLCYPVKWTPPGYSDPILDWFYKYPVLEVDESDSYTHGAAPKYTTYDYSQGKPAWHHNDDPLTLKKNRTWDQFRGFSKIITRTGHVPDPVTQTEALYLQGMSGDLKADGSRPARTVKDAFGEDITDDPALAGAALQTTIYSGSGGTIQSQQVATPWLSAPTATLDLSGHKAPDGAADPLPDQTARLSGISSQRIRALLHDDTWRITQTDTTHDPDTGQITAVDDKGEVDSSGTPKAGSGTPEKCVLTKYAELTAESANADRYMIDRPYEILTLAGGCDTTPSSSTVLALTHTYYGSSTLGAIPASSTGDPTASQVVKQYDTSGNAVWTQATTTTYDLYGRVKSVTDPLNRTTTTTPSPLTDWLPTSLTTSNPKTWNTTSKVDPARALSLSTTDPNGRATSSTYDGLGRLTAAWGPLQPQASNTATPSARFSYTVPGNGPVTIKSETLRENKTYAVDYKIYDVMLRLRQEQATTPDASTGSRVITDTFYDTAGRTAKSSAGYYNGDSAPTGIVFDAVDGQVPNQTVTTYDGQGRPITVAQYSLGTKQWQANTAYRGTDAVDTTPPAGGYPATTLSDGRGQKSELWQWHGSTLPGTITDADSTAVDKTSYRYDALGRLVSESDTVGRHADGKKSNTWTTAYNQLGKPVSTTDPDAGASTSAYDDAGQLITTTNANGTTLWFGYDELGRKTEERQNSAAGNLLAAWEYDKALTAGSSTVQVLGQPSKSARYNGTSADLATAVPTSTSEVTSYSTGYKPLSTTTTLNSSNTTGKITYTVANYYTPVTERLDSTDYPAEGGLPAETVSYGYNDNGLPVTSGGANKYVAWTDYTHLGQTLRATMGVMPNQVVQTYNWESATGRLLDSFLDKENAAAAVEHTRYTYNAAGLITAASTIQDGATTAAGTDTQCYTYDYLGRLAHAWTDTGGITTAASPTINGMGGCTNPAAPTSATAASRIGGPAPYWQSFTYDATGNRLTKTVHDTKGNTVADATTTETYNPSGTAGSSPHAVQTTRTGSGPADTYAYDNNGQPTAITGSGGAATNLAWDTTGKPTTDTQATGAAGHLTGKASVCLDDPGASTTNGTIIQILACNSTTQQNWTVKNNTLKVLGKCAKATGTANNSQLQIADCDGSPAEVWQSRGDRSLYNPASGKCLSLPGGVTTDGTKPNLYTCSANAEQHWIPTGVHASSYTYDAEGNQLTRTTDGTTTVYLGADQYTVNAARTITGATRYYTLPGAPTAVRTATTGNTTTTLNYQAADPHGTATDNINATALTLTRRLTTPFGEPRGTNPTGWPGDHGFVNGTQDTTTGLTNLGAREYNPALGRFLNPDPLQAFDNPQQWNGYAYAGNNPVNSSDPSGLMGCMSPDECNGGPQVGVNNPRPKKPVKNPGNNKGSSHPVSDQLDDWIADHTPHTTDVRQLQFWFDLWIAGPRQGSGDFWNGAVVGDKDGVQQLCFGRSACAEAGRYLRETGDVVGAKYIAATYCLTSDCGSSKGSYEAQQQLAEFFPMALSMGAGSLARGAVEELSARSGRGRGGPCSFSPDTLVLLKNGHSKPIAKIKVGDKVEAASPSSGRHRGPRPVTATHIHHDYDLVDLRIRTADDSIAILHTTSKHPFWDETLHTWVPAGHLKAGHALETATDRHVTVIAVAPRPGNQDMYNLTVADLHTYYVLAGYTPILVHNSDAVCDLGESWAPKKAEQVCGTGGCTEVAKQIQARIGGTVTRITDKYGAPWLGKFRGVDSQWQYHDVLVKDGRVFDATTNRYGEAIDEYRSHFEYGDDLMFTPQE